METVHRVLWSETITRLYHVNSDSALEQRLNFSRLATFPAALANWPNLLGIPGLLQMSVILTALTICYLGLRGSGLYWNIQAGLYLACYLAATLLTNFALVGWFSRATP